MYLSMPNHLMVLSIGRYIVDQNVKHELYFSLIIIDFEQVFAEQTTFKMADEISWNLAELRGLNMSKTIRFRPTYVGFCLTKYPP